MHTPLLLVQTAWHSPIPLDKAEAQPGIKSPASEPKTEPATVVLHQAQAHQHTSQQELEAPGQGFASRPLLAPLPAGPALQIQEAALLDGLRSLAMKLLKSAASSNHVKMQAWQSVGLISLD